VIKLACVIPTLNRPKDIVNLSLSLNEAESHAELSVTIIFVDNSIDGNAKAVIEDQSLVFKNTYLHQLLPGLSNARNLAIDNFKGDFDYFCFIDDDIIVPVDFFLRLHSVIRRNPQSQIIGGRVELYNNKDLPITIKTETEFQKYNGEAFFGFVFGCAMLVKTEVFHTIGNFDRKLGAGTKNGGSEDSDFVYRCWKVSDNKDLSVVYDPEYYVYHNHGRRESEYIEKLLSNYSKGQGGFICKHALMNRDAYVSKVIWWEFLRDIKGQSKTYENFSNSKRWWYRVFGLMIYLKSSINFIKR